MSKHVDWPPIFLPRDLLDQFQTVPADLAAMFRIFVCDRFRGVAGKFDFLRCGRAVRDSVQLSLHRPSKVDRRWPGGAQHFGRGDRVHRCPHSEIHPVTGGGADQPRSAHAHFANRHRHLLDGGDILNHEPMRQRALVDQLHYTFVIRLQPDGAIRTACDIHRSERYAIMV